MTASASGQKVDWYRIPVGSKQLSALNKKSDLKAFVQTLGFLGLLACTGTAAVLSVGRLPWYLVVPIFFFHGMCWPFLINGFHELIHDSVFKTKWLNGFFLRIFSFLGWYNHIVFWASHTEHHKFTLHPPDDLEEVLPSTHKLSRFLKFAFVNPLGIYGSLKTQIRYSRGRLVGVWENHLFEDQPVLKRKLSRWARIVLIGHGTIVAVSCYMHWWTIPLVTTFAPFYGGALHFLTNSTQHAGLQDNVPDFRLCCRTVYLNPFLRFIYWNMNYHTEHHMYAGVPCYNLPKLHELIKADMPECPNGLFRTWKLIIQIMQRQKYDRSYLYAPQLPPMRGAKATKAVGAVPNEPSNETPSEAEFMMAPASTL
ncbi:fatty acid desaturase family protein [soil metagenome]